MKHLITLSILALHPSFAVSKVSILQRASEGIKHVIVDYIFSVVEEKRERETKCDMIRLDKTISLIYAAPSDSLSSRFLFLVSLCLFEKRRGKRFEVRWESKIHELSHSLLIPRRKQNEKNSIIISKGTRLLPIL